MTRYRRVGPISRSGRRARCAAAQRSEFRACKRDPPPHPLALRVTSSVLAYTWDHRACGAVRRVHTFILSLQRHGDGRKNTRDVSRNAKLELG